MVADAHAPVDPLAVVVVPVNAHIAYEAVTGLFGAHHLASRANILRSEILIQFKEGDLGRLLDVSRVSGCNKSVSCELDHKENNQGVLPCMSVDERKYEQLQQSKGNGHQSDVEDHRGPRPLQLHDGLLDVEARQVHRLLAENLF